MHTVDRAAPLALEKIGVACDMWVKMTKGLIFTTQSKLIPKYTHVASVDLSRPC